MPGSVALTWAEVFPMRNWINRFTSVTVLLAVGSIPAVAQYGGGMPGMGTTSGPYTAPKSGYGGSGAAIGIGLGAAAGAGGLAYWMLHKRANVVGCVERSGQGNAILNEKDGKLYHLLPDSDVALKAGERVALKGKKDEEQQGRYTFSARRMVKDYGACELGKASAATSGGSN